MIFLPGLIVLRDVQLLQLSPRVVASAVDEQKITSALVILRQNSTARIAIYADVQLQAEGTWSRNASSPEEILLKITGGVLASSYLPRVARFVEGVAAGPETARAHD